jgi:hypothetical protein
MQTEKQRERLVELIQEGKSHAFCDICEGRSDCENCENERIADHLIANGVTVEIKQEEMTKIIMDLLKYAKSKNSVAVELQKDEYLYLLEYMEKSENVLKERKNEK